MAQLLRMTIVAILMAASTAGAQEQWDRFRGGYGRNRYPPRYPTATSFDGGFNFCQLMYTSDRREAGGSGWSTDYWDADIRRDQGSGIRDQGSGTRDQGPGIRDSGI
jgi:hypothetical protein